MCPIEEENKKLSQDAHFVVYNRREKVYNYHSYTKDDFVSLFVFINKS